jgi:sec-independent protein translocase protein TatA
MHPGAIFGLGPLELVIIVAIVVVLFLPALLPKIVKRFGDTFTTVKDMAGKGFDEDDGDKKSSNDNGANPKDRE